MMHYYHLAPPPPPPPRAMLPPLMPSSLPVPRPDFGRPTDGSPPLLPPPQQQYPVRRQLAPVPNTSSRGRTSSQPKQGHGRATLASTPEPV